MKLNCLFILAAAALWQGCDDPRNDNMPAPTVYLVNSGDRLVEFYDLEATADIKVHVHCSGFEETSAQVSVHLSPEALETYNRENGTAYRMLDEKYYRLPHTVQTIPTGARRATFPVSFDCQALAALPDMEQYAVALELTSESGVPVNKRKSAVLLRPDMKKAEVVMITTGLFQQTVSSERQEMIEYEIKFKTEFENKKECDLDLDTSAAVLDAYNAENHTILKPFPAGSVEIAGEPKLEAGQSEVTLKIRIDPSKIAEKGVYSIPVRLVSTSCYEVSKTQNQAIFRVAQVPDTAPEPLDRSEWTNLYCSSYQAANGFLRMIDDNPATIWETRYSAGGKFGPTKCPFEVAWDFGKAVSVNGVGLLRRKEVKYVTDLKSGYFEVSPDNVAWYRVAEFDYEKSEVSPGPFRFYFEKSEIRYLKLVITQSNRSTAKYDATSVAELYTYKY